MPYRNGAIGMAKRKKTKKENPSGTFTDIEMKLLRLALDKGAYEGESDNAAIMLIHKLRERGVTADGLVFGSTNNYTQTTTTAVTKCGNEKMTFGKYRNERIKDVPIDYLMWAIYNCSNMDVKLKLAIHRYLMADVDERNKTRQNIKCRDE